MTLIEAMRSLRERRATLMLELAAIDQEFAEARQLLGLDPEPSQPVVVATIPRARRTSSDRVDERRDAIVHALADGPRALRQLIDLPACRGLSGQTIRNDLAWLRAHGHVEECEDGYRLCERGAEVPPSERPLALSPSASMSR